MFSRHNWSFNNVVTIAWPLAGAVFVFAQGGLPGLTNMWQGVRCWEWEGWTRVLLSFSSLPLQKILDLISLVAFCHYCHFAWVRGGEWRRLWQQIDPGCCSFDWYLYRQWTFGPFSFLPFVMCWLDGIGNREQGEGVCGGGNVTPGKQARRKALHGQAEVSGFYLPSLCPR